LVQLTGSNPDPLRVRVSPGLLFILNKIMWEYKRIDSKFKTNVEIESELNKEGLDSWEAVYHNEKRPEKFGGDYLSTTLFKRLKK